MSLKRPLNATGTGGDQSQKENLWPDDDPRVRARRTGPDQGTTDITGYNGTGFSYQDDLASPGAFGGSDIMFDDPFDTTSTVFLDPSQQSFLEPPSGNYALSSTSYTSTPVGLTTEGDENADVDMRNPGTVDPSREQICYGVIINERVRLVGKGAILQEKIIKLKESSASAEPGRLQSFNIERSTEKKELFLTFPDGTRFGYLSKKMTDAMDGLIDVLWLDLEAFAPLTEIGDAIRRAAKAVDAKFRANINVYGLQGSRDRVGRALSSSGLFLQAPEVWRQGVRYDNPHMLRMDGMEESDVEEVGREEEEEEEEEAAEAEAEERVETPPEINQDFDDTMARIFGSLQRQNDLHRVEGGENLSSKLFEHQEQALDFMIQRETGNISEEYRLWKPKMVEGEQLFCHVIVPNLHQRETPDESGGGILADEMGMGKSLTMLVLIEKTMREARQWAEEEKVLPEAALSEKPCRATLVIVPSRVLITTWTREIERHLNGSLEYLLYHGRGRSEYVNKIEEKDIVITTYNTLAKEHSAKLLGQGKSPLHEIKWYRIVLDEAHWIRRRETTFHKAVIELTAKSRWCLSGTPIQNSLADLASLLVFIQVRPFQAQRHFRYWISQPFEEKARKQKAIQRLTDLLEAICLRRTIERANLPKPQEETRTVLFTPQEREQYRLTNADMERYFAQQPSEYKESASAFGMFQIFLQLRSFCNHGTYQPRFSWAKRNFLDEEADDVRSLTRTSWDRCLGCRQPLPIIAREQPQYVEKCAHVLCEDCCKGSNRVRADGKKHCPLCESFRSPNWNNAHDSSSLHKEGYSSKMQALVEDVQKNIGTTQSIIFSCWTRTLDLIGRHLRRAKIPFARIDGKTPSGSRQSILDSFDSTRSVPVLIMTTGTGAFGLNLQSVNRVFIVEPQWNPSVESQAVARAIRLGQHQQVRVIRYRVENSIEERMYTQQANKQTLSKMEFGRELLADQQGDPQGRAIIGYPAGL